MLLRELLVQRIVCRTSLWATIRFADIHPGDRNTRNQELTEHPGFRATGQAASQSRRVKHPGRRTGQFLSRGDDEGGTPVDNKVLALERLFGRRNSKGGL